MIMGRKGRKKKRTRWQAYWDSHWLDISLDGTVIVGIVMGVIILLWSVFQEPSVNFKRLVVLFDIMFVGVLLLDTSRNFFRSKNFFEFLKHQWLDLIVLALIIITFSSVLYAGTGRLAKILKEDKALGEGIGIFRKIFR